MPSNSTEYMKKYYQENKQYISDQAKISHDRIMITNWKSYGIKLRDDEDWDSVYIQWFIQEKCVDCDCILTDGTEKGGRCLDHDHKTGFIRDIVCRRCNVIRG